MANKKKPTATDIERAANANDRKMALENARHAKKVLSDERAMRREYDRNQSFLNPGSRQLTPEQYERQYQNYVKGQRKAIDDTTKYGMGKPTSEPKKKTVPTPRKK